MSMSGRCVRHPIRIRVIRFLIKKLYYLNTHARIR